MKKLYRIELTTDIVVVADSDGDALVIATNTSTQRDVVRDAALEAGFPVEVSSPSELPDGWDDDCIPYGGDGNTRISELMTHNARVTRGAKRRRSGRDGWRPGGNCENRSS